tara:strand:+ start:63 stop:599 length:537 start_codon:yes stop_codon:yes gene_type:complete
MYKIETNFRCGSILFSIPNFSDNRGEFTKLYNFKELKKIGITFTVKEHFHSISNKNVLRGMHFQINEGAHTKIVQCIKGSILDVFVDVRKDSDFYNKPVAIKLKGNSALYLPKGMAHGFLSLENNTIVQYLVDKEHNPKNDRGVLWNSIDFNWPIEFPLLSDRDKKHPLIGDQKCIFF